MWVKRRHRIVFAILRPIFGLFLRLRFGYKAIKYPLEKRPYLILSNHQTTLDPFNLAKSFKRPVYFMASEDLFINKFIGPLIRFLVAPVPKQKSNADMRAIRDCMRVIKEGGTIGIFPEGNRTYSGRQCAIDPAIVKLVQLLKVPVVLYNIHGGYGVEPRWASNIRKGRSYGRVREVIDVETIASMSNDELYQYIKNGLNVHEAPSDQSYYSKRQAEKLERVLFLCPECNKTDGIYSQGKQVKCRHCGFETTYTNHLTFTNNKFKTVDEWYTFQEQYIENYQFDDHPVFKDDNVKLYDVSHGIKKSLIGYGDLSITRDLLILTRNNSSYAFRLSAISSMTVLGKNKLNFYINDQTFQIKGEKHLNVLKYMQIFYKIKGESNELFRL